MINTITLLLWSVCFSVPVMWHAYMQTNNDFSAGTNIRTSCLLCSKKHSHGRSCRPRSLSTHTVCSVLGKSAPARDIKHFSSFHSSSFQGDQDMQHPFQLCPKPGYVWITQSSATNLGGTQTAACFFQNKMLKMLPKPKPLHEFARWN